MKVQFVDELPPVKRKNSRKKPPPWVTALMNRPNTWAKVEDYRKKSAATIRTSNLRSGVALGLPKNEWNFAHRANNGGHYGVYAKFIAAPTEETQNA